MFDPTQKNKGTSSSKENAASDKTAAHYDYSHLREPTKPGHWYATPSSTPPTSPPSEVPNRPPEIPQQNSIPTPPAPPIAAPFVPSVEAGVVQATSKTRRRIDQRRRRRVSGMPENWAWVVIASALLGLTIVGSLVLAVVVRYAIKHEPAETLAEESRPEPTSIIFTGEGGESVGGALDGNSLELLYGKWDGQERFTILLMGLDKRPSETGSYFRTDVMILISLDPKTNSIGMLSIPRDLFVEVPYGGLQRINAAYVIGEREEPGGGPRLAMQTVQYNFGIRVNEYITVDFQSVIGVIDAVGGIDIEVEYPITDYHYPTMDYGEEVFHVDAGWQHFDGATALKYARTRHSTDDIDRSRRQQQVIYAIRDRVVALDMVDDLLVQAPQLYANLQAGISTGLSFDQLVALALWAKDVPRENIHNGIVSWEYVIGYTTEGGANVLVPNRYKLGPLMEQVFGADYNQ